MTLLLMIALMGDAQSLVREGNEFFQAKDYEQAETKYLEARVDAPESPIIAFNIGNVFLARDDYTKARDHYEQALQTRDPNLEARIKYNLGHTYFDEAQTRLEDVSDPEKVQATVELIRQAIRRWRDVLKLEPEHPEAKHNIAVATRVLKDYLDRVKRYQEEQQKKAEEEKGESLADILKKLIERQEAEKTRTDGLVELEQELATYRPVKERYAGLREALEKALENQADPDALERIRTDLAAMLADPAVVDGAPALQKAEKALAGPEVKGDEARSALDESVSAIDAEINPRQEKAQSESKTGRDNQTTLKVDTQGVVGGLEAQIAGPPPGSAPPPGQQAPPVQGPPLPPEQKRLLEEVKALVEQAVAHQGTALSFLELSGGDAEKLSEGAATQQAAVDKLTEALDKLPKQEPPPQNQDDKKNEDDQQDKNKDEEKQKEGDKKKQEEKKSLSKEQAEDILRRIQEKEQQKKREKQQQLLRAMGRQKVDNDW